MSIQSNINQGLSLVSLLLSQSPGAKAKEADDAAAIAKATTIGKEEGKKEAREERAAQELEDTKRLFSEHSSLIKPYKLTDKVTMETIDRHIMSRENALRHGKKLQDLQPSDALADQLAQWTTEVRTLKGKLKETHELGRQTAMRRKNKPNEDAAISAAAALEVEQDRIAASNAITRSLDISNIDERALPRLERAYSRAVRDTKYLSKGNTED